MASSTFTPRFQLCREKGKMRIYTVINYTVQNTDGTTDYRKIKFSVKNFTTGRPFDVGKEELWDKLRMRCYRSKGNPEEREMCRKVNAMLDSISYAIDDIVSACNLAHQQVSPAMLSQDAVYSRVKELTNFQDSVDAEEQKTSKVKKDALVEEVESILRKTTSVVGFWEDFIRKAESGIQRTSEGKAYAPRTIIAYRKCLKRLVEYQKRKRKTFYFNDITTHFYGEFTHYLEAERNLNGNSIGEEYKKLKHIMSEAYELGLHQNLSFKKFKAIDEDVSNVALTEDEIQLIAELDLTDDKVSFLDKYRDAFLILCYTGLRVGDLLQLSEKNKFVYKGKTMLKVMTQKTNTEVIIPMLWPDLEYRLDKYDWSLPKMSTQKLGKYCREVARLAGVNELFYCTAGKNARELPYEKWELISPHTGRRSACTNMILHKVPTTMVMQISGHKKESTFRKYVNITKEENAFSLAEYFANENLG